MSALRLKTVARSQGNNKALKDRTVVPRGCDLEFVEVDPLIDAFRRMVRGREFDVCELAITTYISARAHGKRLTGLPIFVMRGFHHGAIVYNTKSGVRTPKDLEGRRVGVNRGYTVTTGMWARSILQHQFGVNLNSITWVLSGDEHVAEFRPPSNVVPIPQGQKMADLLASGDLAAAIGVETKSPDVKPLIPDGLEAGIDELRRNGHYPINHLIVVKSELLDDEPSLGPDIFEAFSEAKTQYIRRLGNGLENPAPADEMYRRVMEVTGGDPLPYGIAPNRRMLDEIVQSALEQRIITSPVTVEELFPPNMQTLAG